MSYQQTGNSTRSDQHGMYDLHGTLNLLAVLNNVHCLLDKVVRVMLSTRCQQLPLQLQSVLSLKLM